MGKGIHVISVSFEHRHLHKMSIQKLGNMRGERHWNGHVSCAFDLVLSSARGRHVLTS